MIPTSERLRANRRWSAVLAVFFGGVIAAVGLVVRLGPEVAAGAIVLGGVCAVLLYRFGTRVMRRRREVVRRGLDERFTRILAHDVAYYHQLDEASKQRFGALAAIFLDETAITGAGCEIDDRTRTLIAASAVIPILGFPDWEYATLREVLVRPNEFTAARPGVLTDDVDPILGMVDGRGGTFHGTLILSKQDLLAGYAPSVGHADEFEARTNVGIHEFAHLIDEGDGAIDGVPARLPRNRIREWMDLVREQLEREDACNRDRAIEDMDDEDEDESEFGPLDDAQDESRDAPHRIAAAEENWDDVRSYAFTNDQEFFAVSTEYFFSAPRRLAERHPHLYDMLRETFRQDPAGMGR